jgi:hypothetical protein
MHVYFFYSKGMTVTLLFIFFKKKKDKRTPYLKIIVFFFWGKNSHYTVKKNPGHFVPNQFCNDEYISWKRYFYFQ